MQDHLLPLRRLPRADALAAPLAPANTSVRADRARPLSRRRRAIASPATPPTSGKPFAGGRPIETPFGIIYSPNITPDRDTGIGGWTDERFLSRHARGRRPYGTHLYPAFPYPYFTRMTREDVSAIRAYLDTLEPVRNARKDNQARLALNTGATSCVAGTGSYFDAGHVPGQRAKERGMESRRLSGPGARPLRRLPYCHELRRRRENQ